MQSLEWLKVSVYVMGRGVCVVVMRRGGVPPRQISRRQPSDIIAHVRVWDEGAGLCEELMRGDPSTQKPTICPHPNCLSSPLLPFPLLLINHCIDSHTVDTAWLSADFTHRSAASPPSPPFTPLVHSASLVSSLPLPMSGIGGGGEKERERVVAGDERDDVRVYWEAQESALCAVHCLNSLAQCPLFTAVDLSSAAQDLYQSERELRRVGGEESSAYLSFLSQDSSYVSDEGNFSVDVLQRCLQAIDLSLQPLPRSANIAGIAEDHRMLAFIANLQSHWSAHRHTTT